MSRTKRILAATLALLFLSDILFPTVLWALSSGPSQPEFQSFQPMENSEMVDLFSGDFSYNIPLLDVEGYPVNLFYQGGITMDQEASWVGLGWNINAGAVERNMRGLPDDLAGEPIKRRMYMRPNRTIGFSVGYAAELWGTDQGDGLSGSFNASISPSVNNYQGIRIESTAGLSMGIRSTKDAKSGFTAGLGLGSGSHSGLRLRPSVGIEAWNEHEGVKTKAGLNFGLTLDSRKGLTDLTLGVTASSTKEVRDAKKSVKDRMSSTSTGSSASFDLGVPTYTPQLNAPMSNLSISFNIGGGTEASGFFQHFRTGGSFSVQHLRDEIVSSPGYGYLYLDRGQSIGDATLDFNREKGGPYTPDQAALGIALPTYDLYSVSAQGVSGSYRPFRTDIGHVFDQRVQSGGADGSLGLELGGGILVHGGMDVMVNSCRSWSGPWRNNNGVAQRVRYRPTRSSPLGERVFFRAANEPVVETDSSLYEALGTDRAMRFAMDPVGGFDMYLQPRLEGEDADLLPTMPSSLVRSGREARAQVFSFLTHSEVESGLGLNHTVERTGGPDLNIKGHHMSEITILDQQGQRFVFGLPAYNILQEDVTFSKTAGHADEELVSYDGTDASTGNRNGVDHFYSSSTMPPYAYAYLLTAVVSPDYSDVDDVMGPSEGDLGTYTRFTYDREVYAPGTPGGDSLAFPWRTPATGGATPMARAERNLGATTKDDRASYTYGEKETWYMRTIQTRNRIAVFEMNDPVTEARQDAVGVTRTGTLDTDRRLRYLKKITLYDRHAYEAWIAGGDEPEPIKCVNFTYSYDLCPGTPNSTAENGGKLTLKRVFFTHGRSNRGMVSPYVFSYGDTDSPIENPAYDLGSQDRWGMVKPDRGSPLGTELTSSYPEASHHILTNSEFPYAEQTKELADLLAGVWNLRSITLPTGARVSINYGSDDYAYVQDRPAMRMFRVQRFAAGCESCLEAEPGHEDLALNISSADKKLYFRLPQDLEEHTIEDFIGGLDMLYFRAKVHFGWTSNAEQGYDYVSGYAEIDHGNSTIVLRDGGGKFGVIKLVSMNIDEGGTGTEVDPIYRAALEHARLNYPDELYTPDGYHGFDDDATIAQMTSNFFISLGSSLAGFVSHLDEFFQGPNEEIQSKVSLKLRAGDTYIRLLEPDHQKMGGGHRVTSIQTKDFALGQPIWLLPYLNEMASATYTTRYTYGDATGSFGVAAYEPMAGSDENPFRRPVYSKPDRLLNSDERFYQEEPFGESLFPACRVGYSKVIVDDGAGVPSHQARGKVVHEFYTARDFPTRTSRTTILPKRRKSPGLANLVGVRAYDHMHTSQGFVVETNDMHGKPKAVSVYAEGGLEPISQVSYHYKTEPGTNHLDNSARVIHPDGTIGYATIGRSYEIAADLREFGSVATSGGVAVNLDVITAFGVPLPIPPVLPRFSLESTRYRSAVLVKKIERAALLEKVVKMDHGSVISTENLAHDAITGKVLLTRSNNEYQDPVYAMEFPAYWRYDGMGPAYLNLGASTALVFAAGTAPCPNARDLFTVGDELAVIQSPSIVTKAWVRTVGLASVSIIDANGDTGFTGDRTVKIIRSGRKNLQDVAMASIISQVDPLTTLPSNTYARVLKASAVEFKDRWRTECACRPVPGNGGNEYRDNRRGVWRLQRERAWLCDRTRSTENDNTNIRRDGVFTTFDPFYKLQNARWSSEPSGWTLVKEVTDYTARSQAVQERNALGIYSAATVTHRGMMVNSVAANAEQQETGFESFEAVFPPHCSDGHFRFSYGVEDNSFTTAASHTGRTSLRVPEGSTARMRAILRGCTLDDCSLNWEVDLDGSVQVLSATGVTGNLTIDQVNILDGTPTIQLVSGGLRITPPGAGTWSVSVVGSDDSGCSRTIVVPIP